MNPWVKRWATIVLTLATLVVVMVPAATAAEPPADPDNDIVSFELVQDGLTRSKDCSVTGYHIELKNSYGVVLVKVGVSGTHWCWRNGNVVSKSWGDPWCWTAAFTIWNCQNSDTHVEAQSKQDLPRKYVWKQWRFHLHYCVTWFCKDKYPWIYIGVRGDGTSGVNGGLG